MPSTIAKANNTRPEPATQRYEVAFIDSPISAWPAGGVARQPWKAYTAANSKGGSRYSFVL